MKRFVGISLASLLVFLAIGYFLTGPTRWIAFTVFWLTYFTLIGLGVAFIQLRMFCPAICKGPPGKKRVALTFDDGPDPATTPLLLDYLKSEKISATFFCIGKNIDAHPQIARRIVEEGHLIANHTYNHHWWTPLMWTDSLTREITETQNAIERATQTNSRYMRPPMGMTNPHFGRVLRRAGLKMIGWDVRSLDTQKPADEVIERVLKHAKDGSIVLLHDGSVSSAGLMRIVCAIVKGLRDRGLEFESVDGINGTDQ